MTADERENDRLREELKRWEERFDQWQNWRVFEVDHAASGDEEVMTTVQRLDHTLRAYGRLERRSAEKGREIARLREDADCLARALTDCFNAGYSWTDREKARYAWRVGQDALDKHRMR